MSMKGEWGATEIHLKPQGKIIQLVIDDKLVIYIEPLSLPHSHNIQITKVNYLVPDSIQGARGKATTPARGPLPTQRRTPQ